MAFMIKRFVIMFLMEASCFIILPNVLGYHFHGHSSYKEYFRNLNDDGHAKTASYEMTKNHIIDNFIEDNSKNSFKSSDVRNDCDAEVPRCGDQTFCEDVPNYPQNCVNQMLAENSDLSYYAHKDLIEISPRFDDDKISLCPFTERLIRPKTAENLRKEWKYILQGDDSNFQQSVRVEICSQPNTTCKMIDDKLNENYVSKCEQKYIYRQLSAIINGEPTIDYFRFPASCCCSLEFHPEESQ